MTRFGEHVIIWYKSIDQNKKYSVIYVKMPYSKETVDQLQTNPYRGYKDNRYKAFAVSSEITNPYRGSNPSLIPIDRFIREFPYVGSYNIGTKTTSRKLEANSDYELGMKLRKLLSSKKAKLVLGGTVVLLFLLKPILNIISNNI